MTLKIERMKVASAFAGVVRTAYFVSLLCCADGTLGAQEGGARAAAAAARATRGRAARRLSAARPSLTHTLDAHRRRGGPGKPLPPVSGFHFDSLIHDVECPTLLYIPYRLSNTHICIIRIESNSQNYVLNVMKRRQFRCPL